MANYAIFCSDPLNPRSVEPEFVGEFSAAREAGFAPVLIDHDALDQRIDPKQALRSAKFVEPGRAVYRGWMLRSDAYAALFEATRELGAELLTPPSAYEACHHAPGSYATLRAFTPETTWVTKERLDHPADIDAALSTFGEQPVVIKDWVKSQASGYWDEACFIPSATDRNAASRVIQKFRELQGDSLVGGIVFKRYVPLLPVGKPADEHRAFIINGAALGCWPRSNAAAAREGPPAELVSQVAALVPSPFASADFAVDASGRWWLLEVGDGQVSGLPSDTAAKPLFEALASKLKRA
ncbi:MAG: ATP-grasp domain-containing protein [Hyphomonadaceae bacterium]|nr:ATP-grasp domain-containing protein [Hyphomonadaceae bacterium]